MAKTNLEQFAHKVRTMRLSQTSFFRTRSKEVLNLCKQQEREVDELCKSILDNPPTELL
jgi:hypothetical protein